MTKEKAIEYLKRADVTVGREIKTKTAEALEMAIKALEESRWIPITERLPDKTDWYLCTLSGHLAQTIVDMCRFEAVNGGFWSGCIEYNVVAWMELPKPYKEGAEDDTHN